MIILTPFILFAAYYLLFAKRDHNHTRAQNTPMAVRLYPEAVGGPVDTQETGEQRFTCLQFVIWPLLAMGYFLSTGTPFLMEADTNGYIDPRIWVGFVTGLAPALLIGGLQRRTQWGDGAGHLAEIIHGTQTDPTYRAKEIWRMSNDGDWSRKFESAGDREAIAEAIDDYLDRPDIRFNARIMYHLGRWKIGKGL